MKKSDSIKEIASALTKVQGELEGAKKDSTNPHFKSHYANLASIVDSLKKTLPKHGLSYSQSVISNNEGAGVETILMHTSGEYLWGEPFVLPATKIDPQGYGSCITYARRYSLASITGMAPEDDDDANDASKPRGISGASVVREVFDKMSPEEQDFIRSHFAAVQALFAEGKDMHAYIEAQHLDADEKMALWSLLPSNVRAAIKKQAPKPALVSQA